MQPESKNVLQCGFLLTSVIRFRNKVKDYSFNRMPLITTNPH